MFSPKSQESVMEHLAGAGGGDLLVGPVAHVSPVIAVPVLAGISTALIRSDSTPEFHRAPGTIRNIKKDTLFEVSTSSQGRHSVRISGLSTIDFRAGFSRKPTMDLKKTSSRPVQGIPTHILINTTGLASPARADRLELLSITGDVVKTLPILYYPARQPFGLWNITEFIPPDEAFFLRITGYDVDGYVFQRVSSVSFSSIVPDAPKVVMPATTPGYYHRGGAVACLVDSLIPYTVRFTRDGRRLGEDQLFRESERASWEIPRVTLKDEGYYECIAISSAGTGRARTFLDVSEPPPAVTAGANVTTSPGAGAVLTCHVVSTVRFNLTWLRGGREARADPRASSLANLSLELSAVAPEHAGWYQCVAANEGGVASDRVYLTVQELPRVSIQPQNQSFVGGQEVRIRCWASGYPAPRLVWTHNGMFIMGSSRHRMSPDGTLVIRNSERKDGGVYGCLASNQAGTHTQTSTLSYIGEQPVGQSPQVQVDALGGTMTIAGTQAADAGEYTCVAGNSAGTSSGRITLDVGAAPTFTQAPADVWADIGSNLTLACRAQGYPEPLVTWRRGDGSSLLHRGPSPSTVTQSRGELHIINQAGGRVAAGPTPDPDLLTAHEALVLGLDGHPGQLWWVDCMAKWMLALESPVVTVALGEILVGLGETTIMACSASGIPPPEIWWYKDLWVEDEAVYVCEAHNHFGTTQAQAKVTVTGLVAPVLALSPGVLSVVEQQPVTLPCLTSDQYVTVRRDGSLHIERVRVEEAGEYTCLAENVVGASNSTTLLHVYVIPTIQHGPQVFDGSLRLSSPSGRETGEFVCTATNAAGFSSRKVQLTVYVRPRPSGGDGDSLDGWAEPSRVSVVEGREVILPCEILEARVPDSGLYVCLAVNIAGNLSQSVHLSPSITWTRDGARYPAAADGSLALGSVGLGDEGSYSCLASNSAGTDEARVQLLVQVPPVVEVLEPPFNSPLQERVANQRIAFPCPAKGLPKPVIRWLRNGQELTGSEPGVSILEDGTLLLLSSVSPLDNGEYSCTAANDAGSTEKKYQLKVNVPPVFRGDDLPGNVSVVLSQPTSLSCDVTGSPTPFITWYKDGKVVVSGNGVQILDRGRTLRLLKASSSDAGGYSCRAINIAGSSDKDFFLDVLVPPSIIGTASPKDLSSVLNQEISLECKVKGTPFPTIQWYKDRKGQLLRIKSTRLGDQARYQCSVTNAAGKLVKDFNLSVYVPPSIKGSNVTTEVKAVLHTLVTLECEARGVPVPAVTWYRQGQAVLSSRQAQYVERGRYLKIPRAQGSDAGRYTCRVTSVAGTAEKSYELDVYCEEHFNNNTH
ncbi:hypothetical protein CRUP_009103 [Coryphaenoides rupestris]|nr:hypothetical protein CRUP_009103 [Coryphaenoides rupestris]